MTFTYPLISLPASTFSGLPAPRSCIFNIRPSNTKFASSHRVQIQCIAATENFDQTIVRRSGNYDPSIWDNDFIQSITSEYAGKSSAERVEKLKEDVRLMLEKVVDPLNQLELIDDLQRLGLSHHFENEMKRIMSRIYNNNLSNYKQKQESFYAVALEFRILRQHGYDIPTEIFDSFRDEQGHFMSSLLDDCKGILTLYEAVFLLKEGEESIFHEARNFTTTYLREYVKHNEDQYLCKLVNHALEFPLHWRIPRAEARWFIDVYERKHDLNPILLELAKLDFNIVQAIYQEDLKYMSSWWRNLGLAEKLNFTRDRLVENFFAALGMFHEPQFGYSRRIATKVNVLIVAIDDIYDVYGTLDELELFTNAVDRWDISAMEKLPQYMKICFLALYNSTNEMGFDALKDHGIDIIPYLKKAWADLCKSYLLEAQWYSSRYIPTFQEYIDNAWISISASVILAHAYFSSSNSITKESLKCLQEYNSIIYWSSMILRLANDLSTSSAELKRGDIHKSIECYMHETKATEEEAREHMHELIAIAWMKMNKDRLANPLLANTFVDAAVNITRTTQYYYHHDSGVGITHSVIKDHILSLCVNPILE